MAVASGTAGALLATCGPFTDFTDAGSCPFVLEVFYMGVTTGLNPTTYDPGSGVTRLQMAAFLARTVDRTLQRGSRRAALGQFWTTQLNGLMMTTVGLQPGFLGPTAPTSGSRASQLCPAFARATGDFSRRGPVPTATARSWPPEAQVYIAGGGIPGLLFQIDPRQAVGAATTVASNLGGNTEGMAFDGGRIWVSTLGPGGGSGGVSIVTPGASIPWTVTTVTAGFQALAGAVFDGANVWVTDFNAGTLLKLDSAGAILQTVTTGTSPLFPAFDGSNIWVPNGGSATVTVVRASTGAVLQTLSGNGLVQPLEAAFDGQRILVTNNNGNTVSLFKAADLSSAGFLLIGGTPTGVCSDGVSFWIALQSGGAIARF